MFWLASCQSDRQKEGAFQSIEIIEDSTGDIDLKPSREALQEVEEEYGTDDLRYVATLNNTGCEYADLGLFKIAETDLKSALQRMHKIKGKNSPEYALISMNLGGYYSGKNIFNLPADNRSASNYYRLSIAAFKKHLPQYELEYAAALHGFGLLNIHMGKYSQADKYLTQSLEILKSNPKSRTIEQFNNLNNLSYLYTLYLTRIEEGKGLKKEAIKLLDQVDENLSPAEHWNFLSLVIGEAYASGDFEKGDEMQEKLEEMYPEENQYVDYYDFSSGFPEILRERIIPFQNSRQPRRRFDENTEELSTFFEDAAWNPLRGIVRGIEDGTMDQDSLMGAFGLGQYFQKLKHMGENSEELMSDIMNQSLGDNGETLAELMGQAGAEYSVELETMQANGTYSSAKAKEASERYNQKIEQYTAQAGQRFGEDFFEDIDTKEMNTGIMKGAEKMRDMMVDAAGGKESQFSKISGGHQDIASAQAYKDAGNPEEAIRSYKTGIKRHKEIYGEQNQLYLLYMNQLIEYATSVNDLNTAEEYLRKLLGSYRGIYDDIQYASAKERAQYWEKIQWYKEAYYSVLIKSGAQNPKALGHAYDLRLSTKAQLLSKISKIKHSILNSGDKQLIDDFKTLIDLGNQMAKWAQMSPLDQEAAGADIVSLKKQSNDLEKDIADRSAIFQQSSQETDLTWKDVRNALGPGEVAVEILYIRGFDLAKFTPNRETKYVALVIAKDTYYPQLVLLKDGRALENKYYKAYQFHNDSLSAIARGSKVTAKRKSSRGKRSMPFTSYYTAFWEPIARRLPDGTRKIYLSAAGVYNVINVNNFKNAKTGRFVLEEVNVQLLSSTRALANKAGLGGGIPLNSSAVLVGYPLYQMNSSDYTSQESSPNLPQTNAPNTRTNLGSLGLLPGTLKEVNALANLFESSSWEVNKLIESKASEEQVKAINNPGILHIATHGFFDGTDKNVDPMLRSGLLLAGVSNYAKVFPKPDREDGVLTALEASTLSLQNTELVVLSACETALGQLEAGEGVYGLQRAFRIAGAKSMMMSLWKVSDQVTEQLMSSFYANWLKSGDRRAAFIQAQKAIKKEYDDPYFWGAFVMVD